MERRRLCKLLGIEHPVIQNGMPWVANAELAAAVSSAGALGFISPNAGMAQDGDLVENLREQIKKVKLLTHKVFGMNLSLDMPNIDELINVVMEEGVPIVTMGQGNLALYTGALKDAGITVIHAVSSARHAKAAEAYGADAVIVRGYEVGGSIGSEELPTVVLVPQVASVVDIPVLAAGGIADARGYVAALALGAEGVQIGTRFMVTHECVAHSKVKEAIINSVDNGTVVVGRRFPHTRLLKNQLAEKLLDMEASGASEEKLRAYLEGGKAREALLEGEVGQGEIYCGAEVGLINEILSAAEVVESLVEGASAIIAKLK